MLKTAFAHIHATALAGLLMGSVMVTGVTADQINALELTASGAAAMIKQGDISSVDLTQALIDAAEAKKGLNAYITLDADKALAAAKAADAAIKGGKAAGPLQGVPLVIKDNINTVDLPTTAGTPALKDFKPKANAPVLQRLIDAGAIVLGKTNMHELAFGITSNNAAFGAVGNAYDATRFAGGSSGGTAAAVGARLAPAGLGTDTGGSVRIPPALNGVIGFRPTVGRYPGAGIVPISHTRDTAGPIARSMADIVLLDRVMAGSDVTPEAATLAGMRFGVPSGFNDNLDAATKAVMDAAMTKLAAAGVELVPVDGKAIIEINNQVGFPVALYEAKQDLAAYLADNGAGKTVADVAKDVASGDVKFVFDNLILGKDAPPETAYRGAMDDARPKLQAAYADLFARHDLDALVFPTTPLPAQPIAGSDMTVKLNGEDAPTFQTFIRNTDPGSNAALPGLSLPAGLTEAGLPVGLELDGPVHADQRLLEIGLAVEALLGPIPAPKN